MLASKPMPAITWSVVTAPMPAGPWTFANSPARLTDGNPRLPCRLIGPDATDLVALQADFAKPIRPRLFACLSRGPSTGTPAMRVTGRAVGSSQFAIDLVPEGAAPFARTPAGALSAFYVGPGTVEVDAARFDVGPVENTGDSAFLDIGQILAAEAFEFCITRDWQEQLENLTKANETISGQDFPVVRPSRRIASVTVAPVDYDRAIASGDSLQEMQASLAGRRPVLVVPMTRGVGRGRTAPVDQESVARSALFGACTDLGAISIVQGSNLFQLPLKFTERPG